MTRSSVDGTGDETATQSGPVPKSLLGRMPAQIAPMLPVEVAEPFDSAEHIFELMWGGLRTLAFVSDGQVRLRAQNGRDLTPYFPELLCIPDRMDVREAILDGEIVATDSEGHPSFDLLRQRLHTMATAVGPDREQIPQLPVQFRLKKVTGALSYQAFDVLWLDGRSLEDRPLWQRKNRLHEHVTAGAEFAPVDFVDHEGVAFYAAVIDRRLEGVVAKHKNSTYTRGRRSREWLEIRAQRSGDFVIGGYTIDGARSPKGAFAQLLLGAYSQGRFEYVGSLSGGLSDREAKALVELLESCLAERPEFFDPPPLPRLLFWTRPEVVCHVRFSEWSPDGHLRFPIFSSLRPDLSPAQCVVPESVAGWRTRIRT